MKVPSEFRINDGLLPPSHLPCLILVLTTAALQPPYDLLFVFQFTALLILVLTTAALQPLYDLLFVFQFTALLILVHPLLSISVPLPIPVSVRLSAEVISLHIGC